MQGGPIQLALVVLVFLVLGCFGLAHFFRGVRFRSLAEARAEPAATTNGIDFASARWGLGEVLCLFGFHYLGTSICAQLLFAGVEALESMWLDETYPSSAEVLRALSKAGTLPSLAPSTVAVYLFSNVVAAIAMVVLACFLLSGLGRSPMSSVGLQRFPSLGELGRLVLLFASFFLLCQAAKVVWSLLLDLLGHEVGHQPALEFYFEAVQRVDFLWIALLVINAVCVAPVLEELLYRGVLHGFLSRKLGFWAAALLSSLAFAIVHITPSVLFPIFVLGFLLAAIYERRGSLYESIFFHAMFNAVTLIIGWLVVTYGSVEWLSP